MSDVPLPGGPSFGGYIWALKAGTTNTAQTIQSIGGALLVTTAGSSAAAQGIATVATATAQSSLVLKASPGNFYGANATSTAAGYLMLFDATSAPADGTVTPKKVWAVAANGSCSIAFDLPLVMAVGITLVFSSTGPFTKTAATCFMSGEAI